MSNEAANSVRDFLETHHYKPLKNGKTWATLLDEALLAERRMVVEQVRAAFDFDPCHECDNGNRAHAALDQIGGAR